MWIQTGSRFERPAEAGFTHFIEHMLFKGTRGKSWSQLADVINYLGGNVNAYTSQELLCLHAKTIDGKAHEALELLTEMLLESAFPPEEIHRERTVVLEEHRMDEDHPEDLCLDNFMRNLWPGHPLGQPVIGSKRVIRGVTREKLVSFWHGQFQPSRLIVCVCGAFDAAACNRVIRRRLAPLKPFAPASPKPPAPAVESPSRQSVVRRNVEQVHFCLGTDGPHRRSPDRIPFGLMNIILGGGMTSRLFQEIREKRGLAYSIGSYLQLFHDRGVFAVSGGVSLSNLRQVVEITMTEIERICEHSVTQRELDLAREQVIDGMLMGLENTETRMGRLADSLMTHGRIITVDEVVGQLRQIEVAGIGRVARKYLRARPYAMAAVCPKEGAFRLGELLPLTGGRER